MSLKYNPFLVIHRAFPGIRESEAEYMVGAGHVCTYPENTVLCHEGAIESTFYVILEGEVRVTKSINEAEARLLKHLKPGDFFGEMALIHNTSRAATVVTIAPTTVLEIKKEAFERLLQHSSSISLVMVREVSRRLRENDEMAIDDLRLKARELADAYQQLAEQEHARREFLTTIAHELRTPLTAASGFLRMIQLGMLEGEALRKALSTASQNLQQIITLVNDILFLQEMDLILPAFQPTDVGAVVASAVELQREHANQSRVRVNMEIAPELPQISGDAKSLERAFAAILDNAIKFSPDGGYVHLTVSRVGDQVWVKVKDQGVGIPPYAMPHIFERFYRLDEVGGRLFRGVGLGLSIVKQVIEQHNGEIVVESELCKGSTFTVKFKQNAK